MNFVDKIKEKLKKANSKMENTMDTMVEELENMSRDIKKGILKIFNIEKIKTLPMPMAEKKEDNKEIVTESKKREQMQENLRKNVPEIKSNTLDYAIDQYLKSLYYVYKERGSLNSYRALFSLSAIEDSNGKENRIKEERFIDRIKNDDKYKLIRQPEDPLEDPAFYHIRTKNYSYQKSNNLVRLYINLKRENVTDFSEKFIEELGNQGFYFKIDSDKQMEKDRRSEKMVVYCKTDDLVEKVQAIRRVKSKYPNLLEEAKNTNPFLESIDGYMSVAPDPTTGYYLAKDGKNKKKDHLIVYYQKH